MPGPGLDLVGDEELAEVTDVIILEPHPGTPISLFAGSLWGGDGDTGAVSRIDLATRQAITPCLPPMWKSALATQGPVQTSQVRASR